MSSGDRLEVALTDSSGGLVSVLLSYSPQNEIGNAVMNIPLRLGNIMPKDTALLQNFPIRSIPKRGYRSS